MTRDITERKLAEEAIWHQAHYDALTGLPNRMLFKDRLTLALAHAHRNKQMLAVMFIDLDQLKRINDTLGHDMGDRLLQSVADRLKSLVREGDTVARMGGDEFTILLPGICQTEHAAKVAHKILEAIQQPWILDNHELYITTSIGIAIYPHDGEEAQTLLKNADMALYRAKEQGRNNYQLYTPSLNVKAVERLTLENRLRRALERKEFVVYYQPRVKINTGQIVGAEALLRWQHPDLGLVPPAKFIPLAEDSGLIVPIGEWVLRTVCAQNKAWQEAGFPPLRVSVNLSARQFGRQNLVEVIAQMLKETKLEPHYLELEITEGTAMKDAEFTITMLRNLKEMGVLISLDNFGTDYSSFNYLKRFPIHGLKIDQSFVRDIIRDSNSAMIITMIIVLAHNLQFNIIAEGVETEEQLDFLKQLQCDEIQGYLFGQPMPAEAFGKLLQKGAYLLPGTPNKAEMETEVPDLHREFQSEAS